MLTHPTGYEKQALRDLVQPKGALGLVGVLGGMGPLATVDFMQKMMHSTHARMDQEHIPALVSSIPQIPDRTAAYQGKGVSPLSALLECALRLKAGGAAVIVIPCNTAHLWFDELEAAVGLPMLHIVDAALGEASVLAGECTKIGLLATAATMDSGLYVKRASNALAGRAVEWLLPTDAEQLELVTPGILAVKAGQVAEGKALLLNAAKALQQRGATAIVLGCTEIPVVIHQEDCPVRVIDATAALARQAVQWSQNAQH